jgi:2-polyprenyl-3-methyl-5-hydroxy-6-metoxy-1,4-benzoquinol methylase
MKTFSKEPADTERYRTIVCPVCGSDEYTPHWDCGSFRFSRCTGCGHLYQNPQPQFDDLKLRYDEEYFSYELQNERQFFSLMMKGLEDIAFFDRANGLHRHGPFLDVGCATGILLEGMKQRRWDVQGVEICEPAARYGREQRGVPIHVGTLEEASLPSNHFATVHFSHVIEHVPDPRAFLGEVYRILAPSGLCVIVTPDVSGFQARLFGSRWRSAIADHLHLFSHRSLARLLNELGFTVKEKRSWGGLAVGAAPKALKRVADPLAKRFNVGDVMILLCRKE